MSTKSSIKYREQSDDMPGFHLYDDALDDGDSPPVYLRIDGVEVELATADGGASVTVTLPREMAQALGLLDARPTNKPMAAQSAQTERARADIDAIAKTNRGEFDESGGMYFDRKAWGFFAHEISALLTAAQP